MLAIPVGMSAVAPIVDKLLQRRECPLSAPITDIAPARLVTSHENQDIIPKCGFG
jgi:hypothetical protein